MSDITEQQVRHVARLSRLKLTDEEVADFTRQLSRVLDYVAKLQELDVEGVEPMAHPTDLTDRLREDVPSEPMPLEDAMALAPDKDPPYFKVPKVLGDEAGA
jgi:aspartyl-tRNA(Asn)/glutamyl-tRNA(Gln) amidotransferase subunit C